MKTTSNGTRAWTTAAAVLSAIASAATATAALKGDAEFTRVINDVKVLPAEAAPEPANVGDRISGSTAVSTGVKSRAELRFPDKTLTRLGANSVFRMDQAEKTVELDRGVILLQVPKQLGGAAKVRTAAVTAAITGTTVLIEFMPDGFIKIIVIEGEVDVFLNDRQSMFRTLTPGDLWITKSDDSSGLPLPVKVDLERLKKTSSLMNDDEFSPLGNEEHVQEALDSQAKLKQDGELLTTGFKIEGRGRQVTLTQGERQHVLGITPEVSPPPPPAARVVAPPRKVAVAGPVAPERPTSPINVPDSTVFEGTSTINTRLNTRPPVLAYNSGTGEVTPLPATDYRPAEDGLFRGYMFGDDPEAESPIDDLIASRERWFAFKGDEVFITGNPTVDTTGGPRDLIFGATADVVLSSMPPFDPDGIEDGPLWSLGENTDGLVLASGDGSVNVTDFTVAGDGQDIALFGAGESSDVNVTGGAGASASVRVPAGTLQAHAGRDANVAGATLEARTVTVTSGRDTRLGSAAAGAATVAASEAITVLAQRGLTITNSTQLRRLSEIDNPRVLLEAVAGSLEISGGASVDADVVTLLAHRGDINVLNASIAGREIGARVLGTGGTLLVSGSTLGNGAVPADLIRLYGEGAGGVRFTGLTTLNGNSVDIAGTSVTIDPGSRVRLANPGGTSVYADSHNYNDRQHGAFTGLDNSQGGGGPVEVNRGDFGARPPY